MKAHKLTKEIVEDYHAAIAGVVSARIVTIQDVHSVISALETGAAIAEVLEIASPIMRLRSVLDLIGPERLKEFLETTAFALPLPGAEPVIYLPWVPGQGDVKALARQVRGLAHEATHVLRAEDDPMWLANYFAGFGIRKTEEKWGLHTSMELEFWAWGKVSPVSALLYSVGKYYLPPTHVKVLTRELESLRGPVLDGALYTEMGKFACAWLDERIGQ